MEQRVYGWLKLVDGTEIDLEGQLLEEAKDQIAGRKILTYKHRDLGEESNVFVTNPSRILTSVTAVRSLFA